MSSLLPPPPPPTLPDFAAKCEFEYVSIYDRKYVKDAYEVISRNELWRPFQESLLSRGVNPSTGFMFSDNPLYRIIKFAIASTEIGRLHTGSTIGYVMRIMEYIALNGEPAFKHHYTAAE